MEILFVTPYLPSPPGFGGQRRLHGLMAGLAARHTVSCASLVNPSENHDRSLAATREYCSEVFTAPNPSFALSHRGKRLAQLQSLISPYSFEWHTHVCEAMKRVLREATAKKRYDVVNVEFSQLAPYRDELPDGPLYVLDEHNIEHEILRRTAASETGLLRKIYNGTDHRKLFREELAAWRAFDGVSVTSAADRDLLLRDSPQTRCAIVPNAVDLDFFSPRDTPVEPKTILFFGAINYFPNSDGLLWFVRDVLPVLAPKLPGVKLRVVGHTPLNLFSLAREGQIEMKGWVDDVRAEIAKAAVIIAPLRVGGGTRLKILEAMAAGKPVVSTRAGAEGLLVEDQRDLLLADDPATFADKVVEALTQPQLAADLGRNARRLVETKYGWEKSVESLERFYAELTAARTPPAPGPARS